jgi:hypothetical protein
MAAIHMAGALAHRAGLFPWDHTSTLATLWQAIAAEGQDAAGEERALRDVVAWAYSHQEAFWGRERHDSDGEPIPPSGGWAGRWGEPDATLGAAFGGASQDWGWLGFYPHVLRKVLEDLKYEPEGIIHAWGERGWLDADGDRQRRTKLVRLPAVAGQDRVRMVVIRHAAAEEAGA